MKVTPMTEKQIAEANLWAPGVYGFEITDAKEDVSKTSNKDMIKLTLNVYNDEGQSRIMYDYLLDAIPHKVRHLASVCDLLNEYEAGDLKAESLINKKGLLKLSIQKDKSGQYPDKNSVVDYIVATETTPQEKHSQAKANAYVLDDEVPF